MKRLPRIFAATCAALALTSSLALAADAVSAKSIPSATPQACPSALTGQMGMSGGRMGGMMASGQTGMRGQMGASRMNDGHMLGANGQSGPMRGAGFHMAQVDSK